MQKRVEWPIGPTSQSAVPYPTEIFQTSLSLSQISESVLFRPFWRPSSFLTYDWHQLGRKLKEAVQWPRSLLGKWIGSPDHHGSILCELRCGLSLYHPLPQKSWLFLWGIKRKTIWGFGKKLVKSKWGISIYAFRGKEAFKRTLSVN